MPGANDASPSKLVSRSTTCRRWLMTQAPGSFGSPTPSATPQSPSGKCTTCNAGRSPLSTVRMTTAPRKAGKRLPANGHGATRWISCESGLGTPPHPGWLISSVAAAKVIGTQTTFASATRATGWQTSSSSGAGPPRTAAPAPWSRCWLRSWARACGGRRPRRPGRPIELSPVSCRAITAVIRPARSRCSTSPTAGAKGHRRIASPPLA
jgi:hypothetical protein